MGSCAKSFVAAALRSVVREYGMALTASVVPWFPDLPFAERIQVRQLVAHSAGLPEFEFVMPMEPGRIWTPKEIVALAYTAGPPGEPDAACAYNNTGYVLAGVVIRRRTRGRLAAESPRRVRWPRRPCDTFSRGGAP